LKQRIHRHPSLASQVQAALCDDIVTGKLACGERIVVEHLAEHLGVSPTPVREAVACLVQDGLICENADGKLQVVPLTRAYVFDIFLVRSALEGLAAEIAAPCISTADLARLQQTIENTTVALAHGDYDTYTASDLLLHRMIRMATENAILSRELQMIEVHIAYIRGYSQRQIGDHLARSHQEHCIVVEALVQHDAVAARRAMEQHIRQTGERIAQLIEFEREHAGQG
jgi:DNA-binding GntR family transcriptional regulator